MRQKDEGGRMKDEKGKIIYSSPTTHPSSFILHPFLNRTVSKCVECLVRIARTTAEAVNADEDLQMACTQAALSVLAEEDFDRPPPDVAAKILAAVYEILRTDDPFREIKARCNKSALALSDELYRRVMNQPHSDNRLLLMIKLAVCGNLIDFATASGVDIVERAPALLDQPFSILHLTELERSLDTADTVLYLADNAGEIAFDRFLVQELLDRGKRVIVAVKGGPALNDALLEDALAVGLDKLKGPAGPVSIITTGAAWMGVNLEVCSDEFRGTLEAADLIIAKGQAHIETLLGCGRNIFFLSLVKCDALAEMIGKQKGTAMLLWERGSGIK